MTINLSKMYDTSTVNNFFEMVSTTFCLFSHPYAAELAEVKRLCQKNAFEMNKLKQKMEESQTSLVKVCSCLVVSCSENVIIC